MLSRKKKEEKKINRRRRRRERCGEKQILKQVEKFVN